uniref:ORF53d n=1 Tax=Pinus koraiensis TaxID=88728 RepID=A4QMJ0_PINKO|nr:ORF53d [Pinus koraiensis]ABP35362.1 ORF53d [Pinus koraiensis]
MYVEDKDTPAFQNPSMDTRKKRADSAAFCSISLRFTLSPVRVKGMSCRPFISI